MITPQACVPVFRKEPSKTTACRKTSALLSEPFRISLSSLFSSNAFSNVVPGRSEIILAKMFDSVSGNSITRAQSRIEDLAAIVP